jgi:hypothetical protein
MIFRRFFSWAGAAAKAGYTLLAILVVGTLGDYIVTALSDDEPDTWKSLAKGAGVALVGALVAYWKANGFDGFKPGDGAPPVEPAPEV